MCLVETWVLPAIHIVGSLMAMAMMFSLGICLLSNYFSIYIRNFNFLSINIQFHHKCNVLFNIYIYANLYLIKYFSINTPFNIFTIFIMIWIYKDIIPYLMSINMHPCFCFYLTESHKTLPTLRGKEKEKMNDRIILAAIMGILFLSCGNYSITSILCFLFLAK